MDCLKILIDANILLDVLMNRTEFVRHSALVWKLSESGKIKGYVSSLSIANIIYILRKQLDPQKTKNLTASLSQVFEFIDLKASDIKSAAEMAAPDFEDAVQMCCAKRINADFIITRDKGHFLKSPVPAVTPKDFLNTLSDTVML